MSTTVDDFEAYFADVTCRMTKKPKHATTFERDGQIGSMSDAWYLDISTAKSSLSPSEDFQLYPAMKWSKDIRACPGVQTIEEQSDQKGDKNRTKTVYTGTLVQFLDCSSQEEAGRSKDILLKLAKDRMGSKSGKGGNTSLTLSAGIEVIAPLNCDDTDSPSDQIYREMHGF